MPQWRTTATHQINLPVAAFCRRPETPRAAAGGGRGPFSWAPLLRLRFSLRTASLSPRALLQSHSSTPQSSLTPLPTHVPVPLPNNHHGDPRPRARTTPGYEKNTFPCPSPTPPTAFRHMRTRNRAAPEACDPHLSSSAPPSRRCAASMTLVPLATSGIVPFPSVAGAFLLLTTR